MSGRPASPRRGSRSPSPSPRNPSPSSPTPRDGPRRSVSGSLKPPKAPDANGAPKRRNSVSDAGSEGGGTKRDKSEKEETRVRVAVRVRPPVRANEQGEAASSAIHCQGGTLWVVQKDNEGDSKNDSKKDQPRQFVFDWALPPETQQEDVYAQTCADTGVVTACLKGINSCIMCYGQTGAGKTHTLGNITEGQWGIVPRAFQTIFDAIAEDPSSEYEVLVGYVQIYMENLNDLLEPSNTVDLRETPADGVFLTGNKMLPVKSVQEAVNAVEKGNKNRVVAATSMNSGSSRSHSVLLCQVKCNSGAYISLGKLYLVDLAGSERVKKSEVSGQAFDEACFINNSLTCLGRCIEALASGKTKPPFRETKLTRMLSNSFGGRAKTLLVVCAGPSANDTFETVNSLMFGQQAMSVKVKAVANTQVDMRGLVLQLQSQIDEVEEPLRQLEAELYEAMLPTLQSMEGLQAQLDSASNANTQLKMDLEQQRREHEAGLEEKRSAMLKDYKKQQKELAALKEQLAQAQAELSKRFEEGQVTETSPEAGDASFKDVAADMEARHEKEKGELNKKVESYQNAVEHAWEDVQRFQDEKQMADERFEKTKMEAEQFQQEKEEMEATLHDVAADLGRLALVYRTQGKAPDAVPLYMSALAIYEKTLGPEHPEVAKDLVNLGNAFCDQNKHDDAVPLYLRALAIDQKALGEKHPEVAMDLSNLGIVYRVQGKFQEAADLFDRAYTIMETALGPDDPKTMTVARNLAATQVINVDVKKGAAAPPMQLQKRLSFSKKKEAFDIEEKLRQADDKREAVLQSKVERAQESQVPLSARTPRGDHGASTPRGGAGAATPREVRTYKRISQQAQDEVGRAANGNVARNMLRQEVRDMSRGNGDHSTAAVLTPVQPGQIDGPEYLTKAAQEREALLQAQKVKAAAYIQTAKQVIITNPQDAAATDSVAEGTTGTGVRTSNKPPRSA